MVRDDAPHYIVKILGVGWRTVNRYRFPFPGPARAPPEHQRRARSAQPSAPGQLDRFFPMLGSVAGLHHDSRKKLRPWRAVSASADSAISMVGPCAGNGGVRSEER